MLTQTMRKGLALVAAAGIALLGVVAPQVALAEDAPVANPGLIDTSAKGTLVVHKHTQTETNGAVAGNGLEDATVTGDPIAGVTFQVQRLDYDLTTQAGWEALTTDGAGAMAKLDATFAAQSKVTAANGTATFADLPLGAYLVTETNTPDNVTPAAPFVVTLPLTHPTELNKWLYTVHVYPKNAVTSIDKTVTDEAAIAVGDQVTFTIAAEIPRIDVAGGATLKKYVIVDTLDNRLSAAAADVAVTMVGTGAVALDNPADFTVDVTGKVITVTFTDAGRAKVAAARAAGNATTKVQVVIKATVASIGTGTGPITNQAVLFPNEFTTDGVPSNEVISKWGKVNVVKTGTDNAAADKYVGAQFQVYTCTVPAGTTQGAAVAGATLGAAPLTVNGESTFTTALVDGKAQVTIDALRANDWVNGAAHVPTNADWYCLVETKAPEGYELQANPIAFQVLAADVNASPYSIELTVKDVPSNAGFRLPLTGSNAVIILLASGVTLVAGGGALAMANRRKENASK